MKNEQDFGIHPVWFDQLRDAIDFIMVVEGRVGGDRRNSSVRLIQCTADLWPLEGAVIVRRSSDGREFRIFNRSDSIVVE